jgi:hypothetical protein
MRKSIRVLREREPHPSPIWGVSPTHYISMFDLEPLKRDNQLREFYEFMEFQNLMTFEELCSCRNDIEASVLAATRRQKLKE